jgi:DNA-binding SARP family transcriptional activator
MDFQILGPIEAREGGEPLRLGGPKPRALLAYLIAREGAVVQASRLLDELWHSPPAGGVAALHSQVSRLRRIVGDRIVTIDNGYAFRLQLGDEVDLVTFYSLLAKTEDASDPAERARLFQTADAMWRGTPFDGLDAPFVAGELLALEEVRLAAIEERLDAQLEAGHAGDLVAEVSALVARHPLRERFHQQLILALYRSGRQADALEAHRRTRQMFDEELGLDLSPSLAALERAILQHDPSLARPRARRATPTAGTRSRALVAAALLVAAAAAIGGGAATAVVLRKSSAVPPAFAAPPLRTVVETTTKPTAKTIVDAFDGTAINQRTWFRIGEGSGWSMDEREGRLVVAFSPGATPDPLTGTYGARLGTQCTFPGDFDARVDYTTGNWISVRLYTGTWIAEPGDESSGTLRVARHAGVITTYYARDRKWVRLASGPSSGDVSVGLAAIGSEPQTQPVEVDFDNFRLRAIYAICVR